MKLNKYLVSICKEYEIEAEDAESAIDSAVEMIRSDVDVEGPLYMFPEEREQAPQTDQPVGYYIDRLGAYPGMDKKYSLIKVNSRVEEKADGRSVGRTGGTNGFSDGARVYYLDAEKYEDTISGYILKNDEKYSSKFKRLIEGDTLCFKETEGDGPAKKTGIETGAEDRSGSGAGTEIEIRIDLDKLFNVFKEDAKKGEKERKGDKRLRYCFTTGGVPHIFNALYLADAICFAGTDRLTVMNDSDSTVKLVNALNGRAAVLLPMRGKPERIDEEH